MNSRHAKFHWDELPSYFFDGPLLGNGLLGAVLHRRAPERGDARELLWEFNRSDVCDTGYYQAEGYVWSRIGIGKLVLRCVGEIHSSRFDLDIETALLKGEVQTSRGVIRLRAFLHATSPAFWLEVEASGEENEAQFDFVADPSGLVKDFGRVDFEESAIYQPLNPPALRCRDGEIQTHRQTLHCGREWCVAWGETRFGARRWIAVTLEYSHPSRPSGAFDAAAMVRDALERGWDSDLTSHQTWWREWMSGGAQVWLPDDPTTATFYRRQSYILGCIARTDGPMVDLIGPFYCHTIWRAIWWNLNTQCLYLPMVTANRLELLDPLLQNLAENHENLRRNAPREWQHDSLAIGRASGYDCYSPLDFSPGDFVDPREEGRLEAGNLLWALHPIFLAWRAGQNNGELLFDLLKGAVNLYFHLLERADDGLWHLPRTFSPEYKAACDCSYDLSLLRWGLGALLELDDALDAHDLLAIKWRETLDNLAPLWKDDTGMLIGRDVPLSESHRHFSHLLSYWPLQIAQPDQILRRSLQHWLSMPEDQSGYTHSVAAIGWALLGEGELAKSHLNRVIGPNGRLSKTTLYREAGLCLETPILTMESVHQMLLHNRNGIVTPFPVEVVGWETASFTGFRVGKLLLSAARENGVLSCVEVRAEAGCHARIQLANEVWSVDLTAGQSEKWQAGDATKN